jgi:hypothetical protein
LAELAGDPSMSQAVWIGNAALPVHCRKPMCTLRCHISLFPLRWVGIFH